MNKNRLEAAYKMIVEELVAEAGTVEAQANFEGSDKRAARALMEMCISYEEIQKDMAKILSVSFPVHTSLTSYIPPLNVQGPIRVISLCPHHLLPVIYEAFVGYLPKGTQVLGLSKLARVCVTLAKRPILQEQLANDIADALFCFEAKAIKAITVTDNRICSTITTEIGEVPIFTSKGSAVQLIGSHQCMLCRGVRQNALTTTTALKGDLRQEGMEQKFLHQVDIIRQSRMSNLG